MSELNTQAQMIELTDDQLELIEGGTTWGTAVDVGIGFIPFVGPLNGVFRLTGGSIGQNVDRLTR